MPTRSVLLIEYEASLREVLSTSLREFGGWRVTLSDSIKSGVDQFPVVCPDVVLLDASTSETDALIFLEQLKQYSSAHAIPIVLMTARANWFTSEQLRQSGFAGVISKPFNPVTLANQIAQMLGWLDEEPTNLGEQNVNVNRLEI